MIDIKTVLCPVDLTPLSERALDLAVAVCERVGARLVLEHNLDSGPPGTLGVSWMWSKEHEPDERGKEERVNARIKEMLARIPKSLAPQATVTRGPIDVALLHVARGLPAELMVMGTHGPSSAEHKSLTERIIVQSPCPVLTLGEGYEPARVLAALEGTRPETLDVVVPVDFSARARTALDFGAALADRMPHRLILVHAVAPGPDAERQAEASRERLAGLVPSQLADRMVIDVKIAAPAAAILAAVTYHRTIFVLMAARGKSAFKRFLFGATTLSVLRGAACPVLFIPPRAAVAARKGGRA